MFWRNARRSTNIEDVRGLSGGKLGGAGGIFLMAIVVYALGGDPTGLIVEGVGRTIVQGTGKSTLTPEQQTEQADFVSAVLGSTEDVWSIKFMKQGGHYVSPKLVLFTGGVQSGCGSAQSEMGPFYCPLDNKAYLDLDFFQTLSDELGAPGDFARAYVIAHEIGHHVQYLLGISDEVQAAQSRTSRKKANALSVRLELQADCLAGVWANGADADQHLLEVGDLDEALNAATRIGDDVLQKRARGHVVPDSFTHGTAAQRKQAFLKGATGGTLASCPL